MPTGKYRYAETWSGSSDGLHETLVSEGLTSSGRRWALLRLWTKRPRYRDEEGERYVLRIDVSEWWRAFQKHYQELYDRKLVCVSGLWSLPFLKGGNLNNRSPGWWDNGFCAQMCYSVTVAKYKSAEDRLEQVVMHGFDFDSLDTGIVADEICSKLEPMFDFFRSVGRPMVPGDDF